MQPVKNRQEFGRVRFGPLTCQQWGAAPWCITVTKIHRHFMHASWSLPSMSLICWAYYSVAAATVTETQGWSHGHRHHHHHKQLCGKEGGVRGWTEWKDMTVREKKSSSMMSLAGTPCAGDVILRIGTYLKLWQWGECSTLLSVTKTFP